METSGSENNCQDARVDTPCFPRVECHNSSRCEGRRAHPIGMLTIKAVDPKITKYVRATYFNHFGIEKIRSGIEYLWDDGITVVDKEK
ncbi:hypothetical protein RRF57_008843 [Xylaria bambusicola]|uniref:Uncharacterized protein n=1 Tax=Xylaria bambusicola TaxID=326684 RepID=A0AAN7USR2_9PEZI